eukprot:PhM_4_TR8113/c0_g4_i1/m.66195
MTVMGPSRCGLLCVLILVEMLAVHRLRHRDTQRQPAAYVSDNIDAAQDHGHEDDDAPMHDHDHDHDHHHHEHEHDFGDLDDPSHFFENYDDVFGPEDRYEAVSHDHDDVLPVTLTVKGVTVLYDDTHDSHVDQHPHTLVYYFQRWCALCRDAYPAYADVAAAVEALGLNTTLSIARYEIEDTLYDPVAGHAGPGGLSIGNDLPVIVLHAAGSRGQKGRGFNGTLDLQQVLAFAGLQQHHREGAVPTTSSSGDVAFRFHDGLIAVD